MTLFTRSKTAYEQIIALAVEAEGKLAAIDFEKLDQKSAEAALTHANDIVAKYEALRKDADKLKTKASLPPERALFNEKVCADILHFEGTVTSLGERIAELKGKIGTVLTAVNAAKQRQAEEKKAIEEQQRLAQEKEEEAKRQEEAARKLKEEEDRKAQEAEAERKRQAEEARKKEEETQRRLAQEQKDREEAERKRRQEEEKSSVAMEGVEGPVGNKDDSSPMDTDADYGGFSVTIKFVGGGGEVSVTVPSAHSTVLDLKKAIQQQRPECSPEHQLLLAKGKKLEDSATLHASRIAEGNVIHLGLVGGGTVSSPASSNRSTVARSQRTKEQVVQETHTALSTMKSEVPYSTFLIAVNTLRTLINNVLKNPGVAKFSRVRFNNKSLQSKLFSKPGGEDAIRAVGFDEGEDNGEKIYTMKDPAPPSLSHLKGLLDEAIEAVAAANARAAAAQQSA